MTSIETDVREINENKRALTEKIGRVTGSVKIPPVQGEFRYPPSQVFSREGEGPVCRAGWQHLTSSGWRKKFPHSLLLSPFIHAFLTDTTQSSSRENSGSTSQVSQTAFGVWTTMSNITASPLSGVSGMSTSFWMMYRYGSRLDA